MSDIFYSELDKNLQAELNARANAGYRRTTADLNHMVGKIANITITPYTSPDKKTIITEAILGGHGMRGSQFLPSGNNGYLSGKTHYPNPTKTDAENAKASSGKLLRTPPYVTSAEIAIGDHSMGLLNTATVNITIPDPHDIEFMEAIYFRPGRCVEVTIEHPRSAVISTDTALAPRTLKELDSETSGSADPVFDKKYRQLNKVTFEGLIISFSFDYQADLSVTATISLRGTSNIYPEVSLMINPSIKVPTKSEAIVGETAEAKATRLASEKAKEQAALAKDAQTFYTNLKNLVEGAKWAGRNDDISRIPPKQSQVIDLTSELSLKSTLSNDQRVAMLKGVNLDIALIGIPGPRKTTTQQYVSLACLVSYINKYCLEKLKTPESTTSSLPFAKIIFDITTSKGIAYDAKYYKSADPMQMLFTDKENRTYDKVTLYGDTTLPTFTYRDDKGGIEYCVPAAIMINLDVIKTITDALVVSKQFTIGEFLKEVSKKVYDLSGGSIELALVTHPEDHRFLMWNNTKYIVQPGPQPYYVPMTSNDPNGSVVRDFQFSGKLPTDASHLAYALNQDLSSLSESEIAPFVSYLYAQDSNDSYRDPNLTDVLNKYKVGTTKLKLDEKYLEAHTQAIAKMTGSLQTYAADISAVNSAALNVALTNYIKYPLDNFIATSNIAAPIIPFDTSFTIDGINGFKYGDVVAFKVLPERYVRNTVFSVINVTHTISNEGVWTTVIRSIMRPRFDK